MSTSDGQPDAAPRAGGTRGSRAPALTDPDADGRRRLTFNSPNHKRVKWTGELHQIFLDAAEKAGGIDVARPRDILENMAVEGLTINHVKSHLQKHRLSLKGDSARPGKRQGRGSGSDGSSTSDPDWQAEEEEEASEEEREDEEYRPRPARRQRTAGSGAATAGATTSASTGGGSGAPRSPTYPAVLPSAQPAVQQMQAQPQDRGPSPAFGMVAAASLAPPLFTGEPRGAQAGMQAGSVSVAAAAAAAADAEAQLRAALHHHADLQRQLDVAMEAHLAARQRLQDNEAVVRMLQTLLAQRRQELAAAQGRGVPGPGAGTVGASGLHSPSLQHQPAHQGGRHEQPGSSRPALAGHEQLPQPSLAPQLLPLVQPPAAAGAAVSAAAVLPGQPDFDQATGLADYLSKQPSAPAALGVLPWSDASAVTAASAGMPTFSSAPTLPFPGGVINTPADIAAPDLPLTAPLLLPPIPLLTGSGVGAQAPDQGISLSPFDQGPSDLHGPSDLNDIMDVFPDWTEDDHI